MKLYYDIMKNEISVAYALIEKIVYLKTDEYNVPHLVVGLLITKNEIQYLLKCGAEESLHFGFELYQKDN